MIDSCVLKIFGNGFVKGKEAIFMAYSKPKTIAKSAKKTSFVAGCPEKERHTRANCLNCERTE